MEDEVKNHDMELQKSLRYGHQDRCRQEEEARLSRLYLRDFGGRWAASWLRWISSGVIESVLARGGAEEKPILG